MKNFIKIIILIAGLLAGTAQAAVCTSRSAGDWNVNSRWDCFDGLTHVFRIPVAADTVVIAHNAIRMRGNYTVAGITINTGAVLNGNNQNLTVNGAVTVNGTYNTAGGDLTTSVGGSLTVNAGGTFNFNGGNAAINGNVAIDGTLTSGGDNLQMTGTGTTLSGTGNIVGTTLEIDATGVSVPFGANLIFDANSEIDVAANVIPADLTVNGTIDGTAQGAGDRIIRVSSGGALTVGTSGVINAPNSRLDVRTSASATNNGTITIGDLRGRIGAPAPVFTQGANSTLNINLTACSAANPCTLDVSAAGNTVNYSGAAQTVKAPSVAYANLTLSGSGVKIVPTGLMVAENFTMSGAATVLAPLALAVGGDFTIGAGNTFTPGLGTVTLNGAAVQTISGTSPLNFNNLAVTNAANPNLTLATNVVVNGTLSGTVNLTSTCPTNFTLTSGGGATVTHSCPTTVVSINRLDANPTSAATVRWTVTFSRNVAGVDATPFSLVASGVSGAFITTVTGGGASWIVTADTGSGSGTLRLDQTGSGSVVPTLSGTFTGGQAYTITAPVALVEYRFDEGSAGTVIDSSVSGLNGATNGGVAVGGTGKLCTGYNFNGTNAYVSVPNNALLNQTQITVAAWVRHNTASIKAWEAILAKGDTQYRMHLNGGCSINPNVVDALSFGLNGGCSAADIDSGTVPVAGTWYHVTGTYDGATIKIYINGTLADSAAFAAGINGDNGYPLWIGNNSQQTSRYWSGDIDEVKIFNTALSAAKISAGYTNENTGNNWDGTVRVCPATGPDHIKISHDGSALTCSPDVVTITACANADCSTLYTGGVNVTLTPGGKTFVIDATGVNNAATVQQVTVGAATLGAASVPASINTTTCWNTATSTADCSMQFADSGLLVSAPDHVAETAQSMSISAVRKSNNALECVPAFKSVSRTVNLTCTYANPITGTLPVRVAGVALNAGNDVNVACDGTGQSPTLAFDANGTATTTLQYADVGQMTLNATYTGSVGTEDTGLMMIGSGSFIAAPASFAFSAITAAPIKAGTNFNATVTAMNGAATPAVTSNFGKETPAEGVALSFTKCQPTGTNAVNGAFSGSVGAFAVGAANATNLNWSEVGNGDLVATLASASYLGSGLTATGNTGTSGTVCNSVGNVGRFIPDRFDTLVTGPMTCPVGLTCPCPIGSICPPTLSNGMVYSGQSFTTNVYARNAAGVTTQNYDGTANTSPNFAKSVTLTAWDASGSTTTQNPPVAPLGSSITGGGTIASASFSKGATVAPGTPGAPIYTLGTTNTAPTDVYIRAVDVDGVTSLRAAAADSVENGIKVVNGRIKVSNAHGSEQLRLRIFATVQYYDGLGWVTSSTDGATSFDTTVALTFDPIKPPLAVGNVNVVNVGVVNAAAGIIPFTLAVPGVTGSANISIPTPAYLTPETGRITFGVYKGANQFIYMREAY